MATRSTTGDGTLHGIPPGAGLENARLHVMCWDSEGLEESTPARLRDVRESPCERRVVWVNVNSNKDPDVLEDLEKVFGVHPLAVEDVQNSRQRPKVEEYPGYVYVVTRIPYRDEDGDLRSEQVSIIFSHEWLITIQEKPGDVFHGVRQRIRGNRARIRGSGPDYTAYALLDAVVDAYFPLLEQLGLEAEELEDHVLEETSESIREKLQTMRRQLLALRRIAWPQRDAMSHLERGEVPFITPETRTFLRDVSDHVSRVIDFVETNREMASNLMDLYLTGVAQKTNDVMKTLTIVATIFIPLTFIAGVYGMNFEYMPELEWRYGYFAVVGLMFALGLLMLYGFKRRGWL